jgi:excinuclease ABC subunit C
MVVMEDGLPRRADYRRFKIRTLTGQDDFAAMEEVLTRRFRNYLRERDEGARAGKRFAYPPNLLLVDGGKGQLNVAVRVLEDLGLEEIAVASLAKRFEEVFVPARPEPVRIPRDSEALYLLQQVRDEAHRFAITYHRDLRGKRMTRSVLDDVPGLGPGRRARLLKEVGSVKRLRELSLDDLLARSWLPDQVARALHAHLHGEAPDQERGRATMDGT